MNSDYVYKMLADVAYSDAFEYEEWTWRDHRGSIEFVVESTDAMMEAVKKVEARGWVARRGQWPKRLLFGVVFDCSGDGYDELRVVMKLSCLAETLKRFPQLKPDAEALVHGERPILSDLMAFLSNRRAGVRAGR